MAIRLVFAMSLVATVGQRTAERIGLGRACRAVAATLAAKVEPGHAKIAGVTLDRSVKYPTALVLSCRGGRAVVVASAEDGAARRAIIGSKRVRIRPLTGAPIR